MRKVVVEFDEQTFKRLERVASDSSSRRSDFIRGAVRRALWELEEQTAAFAAASDVDSAVFESALRASQPAAPRKATRRRSKAARRRLTR
jgi:metal-responsive CopG/Arc/MetJ family transcriptional regulator